MIDSSVRIIRLEASKNIEQNDLYPRVNMHELSLRASPLQVKIRHLKNALRACEVHFLIFYVRSA